MNVNLVGMIEKFGDESKCRNYLEKLRWPDGVKCPHCKAEKIYRIRREQFLCASCKYQFSVTVDTIFHDTHLPLVTWFLATLLLCEAKRGMSARRIQRSLGIKTYKTAWYLCHRIRAAMVEANKPKLGGVVEMDETFAGGRARGKGRGPLAGGKQVVIGIRQRQGELRFFHADDIRSGTLEKYIRENISENVEILMTDDLSQYRGAARRVGLDRFRHKALRHSIGIYVQGDVHTSTIESAFSLLKRGVLGTWHRISAKHLQAYCNEMCFRFNNRKNPYLFRDTILKLIASQNLEYKELTSDQAAA
jgi:transposase-like protein